MMSARRTLLVLLVAFVANIQLLVANAKIVFTEVMINSINAPNPATQWMELYNTGVGSVSLTGWKIFQLANDEDDRAGYAFPAGTRIGSNRYLVVGNNADTKTNGGVKLDVELQFKQVFPTDGSGFNTLRLQKPDSLVEDEFRWIGNDERYPEFDFKWTPGVSLAKINATLGGNQQQQQSISNWRPSTAFINCNSGSDKGTPGKANSFECLTNAPTSTKCGLLQLGIVCWNGCGLIGRLLNFCSS